MEKTLTHTEGKKNIEEQSCWHKKPKKEKKIIILAVVAVLLALVLVIVLIVYFAKPSSTCLSSGCVKTTSEFLKLIHPETNPCDDFYEFACGSFAKKMHQEKPVKSIQGELYDSVNNRISGIIEEPVSKHDSRPLTLVKNLYRACLNQEAIDARGLVLIQDALRQIGGWPVLEGNAWNEWSFEWKLATYKLRELGYSHEFFIAMDIIPDINDPSKRIIQLSPPDSPLEGATESEEEQFLEFMVNVSVVFGANTAFARSDFRDVIDFQKSLFLNLPESPRDNKYDPLTFSELGYKFSDIPWMEYINKLIYPVQRISHDQMITVKHEAYFKRLQNALRRISKRVVANYIAWRTVREHGALLTSELSGLILNYYTATSNQKPPTPSRKCLGFVQFMLPLPLQAEYVKRFLPPRVKAKVTNMLQNIKNEYKNIVKNLDWMDQDTRSTALERITLSKDYVAYPHSLLEEGKLDDFYRGVEVDENNFFQSMLQANFFRTNRKFQKLHNHLRNDDELDDSYAIYNKIHYTATDNSITVPAGLLQGVIYDNNRPESLNYGALGTTLGHQVFHTVFEGKSCSSASIHYDWLSTRTLINFDKKLSCVQQHYGQYHIPEVGEYLNSSNTKYEDIADIAGVKLAYDAYNSWIKENGVEQKLPGFDYTSQQLFWISSALRFCDKETSESNTYIIAHSLKSPKKYRVLGTLRNLEEFSKDFSCAPGTYMNSKEKCKVL